MFYKKAVLDNFAIFTGKQLCWSLFLIKLQAFKLATLLKRDSNTGAFLCILQTYIYFEKHLQMAVSDHSFTLEIYLFPLSLYNYEEELWYFMVKKMFIEIRDVIQWRIILKGMSKSLKYTLWSLKYQF